eukprot:s156_g10.t1
MRLSHDKFHRLARRCSDISKLRQGQRKPWISQMGLAQREDLRSFKFLEVGFHQIPPGCASSFFLNVSAKICCLSDGNTRVRGTGWDFGASLVAPPSYHTHRGSNFLCYLKYIEAPRHSLF